MSTRGQDYYDVCNRYSSMDTELAKSHVSSFVGLRGSLLRWHNVYKHHGILIIYIYPRIFMLMFIMFLSLTHLRRTLS
jgi:hypothetical protein